MKQARKGVRYYPNQAEEPTHGYADTLPDPDCEARRSDLTRARAGDIAALERLWAVYHLRLPLVEARIGWAPARPARPFVTPDPVTFPRRHHRLPPADGWEE